MQTQSNMLHNAAYQTPFHAVLPHPVDGCVKILSDPSYTWKCICAEWLACGLDDVNTDIFS